MAAPSYGSVTRNTLLSNDNKSVEEFNLDKPLNIVGELISNGVINFETNQDGDLLQIFEQNDSNNDTAQGGVVMNPGTPFLNPFRDASFSLTTTVVWGAGL